VDAFLLLLDYTLCFWLSIVSAFVSLIFVATSVAFVKSLLVFSIPSSPDSVVAEGCKIVIGIGIEDFI